jgi:CcmD family protein
MKMVALAYGFIWLAVFGYVFIVGRRLGKLNGEMDELRRRIDRIATSAICGQPWPSSKHGPTSWPCPARAASARDSPAHRHR